MHKKGMWAVFAALMLLALAAQSAHAQDFTRPTTPADIAAYVTQSNQVYASWSESTDDVNISGYYLYRNGQLVANTPGLLFYTDNAPAGTYTYTVAAYDGAGNISYQSVPSYQVTVVADTEAPSVPANVTLVSSSSSVALSWDPSTDNNAVIGYYVYRNNGKLIFPYTLAGNTYTDTGLSPGYTYTYSIGAYDAAGNITKSSAKSVPTIFDVTPPAPARNLSAKVISSAEIDLTWNAGSDNLAMGSYSIYRNNLYVASVDSSTLTYADYGLFPNTLYSYWVVAGDAVGNTSQQSVPVGAMTMSTDIVPPSIPKNITAVPLSASDINITWQASTDDVGTNGYYIYRDGNQIASTASTSYLDSYLTTSTTYFYAVKAYDAAGNISPQTSVAATTLATNPITPIVPAPPVPSVPPGPPPEPVPAPSGYVFTTLISYGMRGTAVQNLQLVLIAQGNLGAAYATGYFGSLTQKAVQQFQCAQGIVCSGSPYATGWGLVGVRTRKALNALGQ